MRYLFSLFILLLFFCSCQDSVPMEEPPKEIAKIQKLQNENNRIDDLLSNEKEKIILLSEIRKIPFDTLNLLFRDYHVFTDIVSSSDVNSKYLYQTAIEKISDRFKITKSKVAALIFSYKFEMLTKEDIVESMAEDY